MWQIAMDIMKKLGFLSYRFYIIYIIGRKIIIGKLPLLYYK